MLTSCPGDPVAGMGHLASFAVKVFKRSNMLTVNIVNIVKIVKADFSEETGPDCLQKEARVFLM